MGKTLMAVSCSEGQWPSIGKSEAFYHIIWVIVDECYNQKSHQRYLPIGEMAFITLRSVAGLSIG